MNFLVITVALLTFSQPKYDVTFTKDVASIVYEFINQNYDPSQKKTLKKGRFIPLEFEISLPSRKITDIYFSPGGSAYSEAARLPEIEDKIRVGIIEEIWKSGLEVASVKRIPPQEVEETFYIVVVIELKVLR